MWSALLPRLSAWQHSPLLVGTAGCALCCAVLALGPTHVQLVLVVGVSFGAQIASQMVMENLLFAEWFGHEHLGAIKGVQQSGAVVLVGVAPLLAGGIRDGVGSYHPWLVGLAVALGSVVLMIGAALHGVGTPGPPPHDDSVEHAQQQPDGVGVSSTFN